MNFDYAAWVREIAAAMEVYEFRYGDTRINVGPDLHAYLCRALPNHMLVLGMFVKAAKDLPAWGWRLEWNVPKQRRVDLPRRRGKQKGEQSCRKRKRGPS